MKNKPHFLLYPLFILFIIFTQASFGMEEKGDTIHENVLTRKVAIEILPYTEQFGDAALNKALSTQNIQSLGPSLPLPEPSPEKYRDEYGLDHLFCYANSRDIIFQEPTDVDLNGKALYPANSHESYLQSLVQYRKENKLTENLLIAKIVINIGTEEEANNVELVCGVFSSGEPKVYTCCKKEELESVFKLKSVVYAHNNLNENDDVVKCCGKNFLLQGEKGRLSIEQEIKNFIMKSAQTKRQAILEHDSIKPRIRHLVDDDYIIFEKPVILSTAENGVTPLPLMSQKHLTHAQLLHKRYFNHAQSVKLNKTMKEDFDQMLAKRANLLRGLFGSTAIVRLLNGELNCFISDDGSLCDFNWACTAIFHQSEQAFLTFLDSPTKENYFCKTLHFPRDTDQTTTAKSQAINTTVYLYSTLDICRYCRGTFSWLMHTEELHNSLKEFVEALYFKKEEDQSIYQIKMGDTDLKVFAISNEQTQT